MIKSKFFNLNRVENRSQYPHLVGRDKYIKIDDHKNNCAAGGGGGDTSSAAVTLNFDIRCLDPDIQERIRDIRKVTKSGHVQFSADGSRSQHENREDVKGRLNALIEEAINPSNINQKSEEEVQEKKKKIEGKQAYAKNKQKEQSRRHSQKKNQRQSKKVY